MLCYLSLCNADNLQISPYPHTYTLPGTPPPTHTYSLTVLINS